MGWKIEGTSPGGSWSSSNRPREDNTLAMAPKVKWVCKFKDLP
jgi:hypothetical protein